MRTLFRSLVVLAAGALLSALGVAPAAAFHDCAFQDVNDNGVLDPGTDIQVMSTDWIGKTVIFLNPFVVPKGCDHAFPASVGKTHVIAPKITFAGKLEIFKPSGSPIVLEANPNAIPGALLGDGSVTISGRLSTGGQSGQFLFADHVAGNEAIHNRTITIVARGRTSPSSPGVCFFTGAELMTQSPSGGNDIGVHCNGTITIRGSTFQAARINIQSMTGAIDAHATGMGALTLGVACDDPTKNTSGKGNNNGVLDDGDVPCTVNMGTLFGTKTFATVLDVQAFCGITQGPSVFTAFNDPLIMIADQDVDLRGVSSPEGTGDNHLTGRYRVTLASVHGKLLLQNTKVDHDVPPLTVPGGAVTTLASHATSANRIDNDAEDFFGPFTGGVYNIDSACLAPPFPILYGDLAASVSGTPDASTPTRQCAQFPANFKAMHDIIHHP